MSEKTIKELILSYTQIYECDNGGWVWQHELHSPAELQENLVACKILANHGHKIEMLPYFEGSEIEKRKLWLPDVYKFKNPDVRLNFEKIGDIKTPSICHQVTKKCISRAIYSAGQQKVKVAIINLNEREYTISDIKKGIVGSLQPETNKSIEEAWIITKTANLFIVKRQNVFDDTIYEILGDL